MRNEMQCIDGRVVTCSGLFRRYGVNKFLPGTVGKTLLLCDVKEDGGSMLADHAWLSVSQWDLPYAIGDVVKFSAWVSSYRKASGEVDYAFKYPRLFGR
jgi:hypothetical protein